VSQEIPTVTRPEARGCIQGGIETSRGVEEGQRGREVHTRAGREKRARREVYT
jgi:hypothetical protein